MSRFNEKNLSNKKNAGTAIIIIAIIAGNNPVKHEVKKAKESSNPIK